jgi:hypothetical protein
LTDNGAKLPVHKELRDPFLWLSSSRLQGERGGEDKFHLIILNKNINGTCNKFKELPFIEGNQSIEINKLGPNLWISHDWAEAQPWVLFGGYRPTPWGARPSQSE